MNMKSGNIEQFEKFSSFCDLKEFNHHMERWFLELGHEFSKSEIVGLKRLIRYSAKIPGVCNAKIGTILKAIHTEYEGNGISRSTFKRMIIKAKELGIITVHETERKNGSQTSNLYIFNRFPTNEPPKEEKMNHPKEAFDLSKTKKENNNKRKDASLIVTQANNLDYTFTSDQVPQPFVELVKYFYPEARVIEEYWHMTKIAAYRNNREKESGQMLEVSIKSFKQLISKIKSGESVRKPVAYYYGILNHKFEELYFDELVEMGF
ncbi:hypothetical protein SM124_14070 [Bacillus sp. 31A1R]|uniref:Helix-turn-helix domain-containing protein n=1 Tax=Robertmurraya mangrovi TaxID=3098077 RepID=A0ABU5J0I6_9BACI|nr:hypothetical protein [Bacillus sp. 31A1R]MDZ5472855.1 hypothetical protein [Bacillus sp. 31A1R]